MDERDNVAILLNKNHYIIGTNQTVTVKIRRSKRAEKFVSEKNK